ncbi:CPBP family intramembrane metalloprotease [Sphingobium sp. BHU LFT2]|uniref:CPBP family intramembrane glutamic endopeptidase n=1 Tax=Sphingobium sp. BHU LFT2 TaxID=2807634 RepID=UPI001BECB892|nr:CPBP family intramembrane glutamic endopeptidase [Sphingobium sp. BHU LFT2]MBT2246293.1 CPBP family intramembrane metalloprotease [Sphingobium sp. BHU LFT2]
MNGLVTETGVLAAGKWRKTRTLAWMVALAIAVVLPLPLQAVAKGVFNAGPAMVAVVGWLVLLAAYLIYAGLVTKVEKRPPGEVALGSLPREIGIGAAIGIGMFLIVIASLRIFGLYEITPGAWTDWWADIRNAFLSGLLEELIFRLIVFRLLLQAFGRWPALVASAAIFGAVHLMNAHASWFAALAIAIEAGLVLSAVYLATGRVWTSVGLHAGWNFAETALFGAALSGQAAEGSLFESRPLAGSVEILTGGSFGPEASLSAVIVGLCVFAIVMRQAVYRLPSATTP